MVSLELSKPLRYPVPGRLLACTDAAVLIGKQLSVTYWLTACKLVQA